MMFAISLDVQEDEILKYDRVLLDLLLTDQTTHNKIIWATDDYSYLSESYLPCEQIQPESITGLHSKLIRPRIAKSIEAQASRTRGKAEVFTPSWVCNAQNNLVDAQWFGHPAPFNIEGDKNWTACPEKIVFPGGKQKTWQKYVDAKRLEITCGEAPYLVSRYDTVTGALIPIRERIGLLDRKLRVVGENTDTLEDWYKWTVRAFQSVYGYEFQGDNLLLARENLLATFIEYYQERFSDNPDGKQLLEIAKIISWNIWQMDGMKYVIPNSCKAEEDKQQRMENYDFGDEVLEQSPCPGCRTGNIREHTGTYCIIRDWRDKSTPRFVDMMKGGRV